LNGRLQDMCRSNTVMKVINGKCEHPLASAGGIHPSIPLLYSRISTRTPHVFLTLSGVITAHQAERG
jgi:hypothetical protein